MPDKPWSIAQQQERRRQLNAIYLPFGLKHFDAQGTYVAEGDGTTAAGAGQDGGLRELAEVDGSGGLRISEIRVA